MNLHFDAQSWAAEMQRQIYTVLKKYNWRYGMKIFYSYVVQYPDLLIISYQPGGNKRYYKNEDQPLFENGEFGVREKSNVYAEIENDMSKRIRYLTDFSNNTHILNAAVVIPLIFLRAPSVHIWKKEIGSHRKKVENFCFQQVKMIFDALQPKHILIIGIETYNEMIKNKILSIHDEKSICSKAKKRRIAIISKSPTCDVFVTYHLTGARGITNEDKESVRDEFLKWIRKTSP